MNSITLPKADDFHCHLRDGEFLKTTVPHIARQFARAIIMPNLQPAITTVAKALAYKERITQHIPKGLDFTPLMTLYLSKQLNAEEIKLAAKSSFIYAIKWYPQGATTNSYEGIKDITHAYPILEIMQKLDLPLLLHGELAEDKYDIFEREKIFIDTILSKLKTDFPELKIVLEHITTKEAVDYVLDADKYLAATITAHHLYYTRNNLLAGGIKPHYYCLPILKTEKDKEALVKAALSGNQKFFLGTDSAPHPRNKKESACGCAGIYSAPHALELYAEVFLNQNKINEFINFACKNGANFYSLPPNEKQCILKKINWQVTESYDFGNDRVIPMKAGETLNWKLEII